MLLARSICRALCQPTTATLCCAGVEALKSLDLDLDPSAAPGWVHAMAGTGQALFSAPISQGNLQVMPARGLEDSSVPGLYSRAASDAFANALEGKPMTELIYKSPSTPPARCASSAVRSQSAVVLLPFASQACRCACCVGAEALKFLDLDLNPSAAPECAHRIDGTGQALFSAPIEDGQLQIALPDRGTLNRS